MPTNIPIPPPHNAPSDPSPFQQAPSPTLPFKTAKADLAPHFHSIFSVLHLLHEDLKLNKLISTAADTSRLARMITRMALAMDVNRKAAYVEYYIREYPNVITREEADKSMQGKMIREGVDIEAVPRINKWVEDIMRPNTT
jgi:hypothetical protein